MTLSFYSEKPDTVIIGSKRRGKYPVFVTFGVRACNGEDINCRYEGFGCKFELMEINLFDLISRMDSQFILEASEDEVSALMRSFGVYDDASAWMALRSFQVSAYDTSDRVNRFVFDGKEYWLDKNTRVGLANMYRLSGQSNEENVPKLWLGNTPIDVESSEKALEWLGKIEQYATKCYATTREHLAEIENACDSGDIDALRNFDITKDYPDPVVIG